MHFKIDEFKMKILIKQTYNNIKIDINESKYI